MLADIKKEFSYIPASALSSLIKRRNGQILYYSRLGKDVVFGHIEDTLGAVASSIDDEAQIRKLKASAKLQPQSVKYTPNFDRDRCKGNEARKDFEMLSGTPTGILYEKIDKNGKKTDEKLLGQIKCLKKTMSNGYVATLRPNSTGILTLEIYDPIKGKAEKFRYDYKYDLW